MVLDGNSIMNRAFYGIQGPTLLSTRDGLYTNAIYGFANILFKHLEEEKPDYICVAFDLKAPTFRHKEYDAYKAGREKMPEELVVQVPVIKQLLDAMNIKRIEIEGYEADDIIGAVSLMAEHSGLECVILTGDKDTLQLVSATTNVKIVSTAKGMSDTKKYDYNAVIESFGVTPAQLVDIMGLMGDPSDNIPGVPGVGMKTATELIINFGCIENVYNNLDVIENKRKIVDKLKENHELAVLSKRLSTIQRDLPIDIDIKQMERAPFNSEQLYQLLTRLEFKRLIDKLGLKAEIHREAYSFSSIKPVTTMDELHKVVEQIRQKGIFSMNITLCGEQPFRQTLESISIAFDETQAFFIEAGKQFTEEDVLSVLKPILEDTGTGKLGHDFKTVCVYMKTKGIDLQGIVMDTMVGAYILEPTRNDYKLDTIVSDLLNISVADCEQLETEELSDYTRGIAAVIFKLSKLIEQRINQNEQQQLLYEIEIPLIYVLAGMEYAGFRVDVDSLKALGVEIDKTIEYLVNSIYMLAGEEFNINSPKQLGVVLFEKLGLPPIKKTKTGYSTDAEVLEKLSDKHEVVANIIEYRHLAKLKTTYIDGLIGVVNPETGRIHSNFNQTVTATGRISSTEPNLQNIPIRLEMGRQIRRVFVASDTEHLLIDADYSQIELRVLAHITEDDNLIEAFRKGEDIHTVTASQVFGVDVKDVTAYMRDRAKTVNFGIIYGIGDYSLSKDLGITRKEARGYIDNYLDKYPGVRKYMSSTIANAKNEGFVETIFNRRRYIPEVKSSNFNVRAFGERISMNTPIQGSAADIIKLAMIKVYGELKRRNLKSKLILQVHDELIIDTHKEEFVEVANILKQCMEGAVQLKVPLVTDIKTGENWYETT